ncbi:hypothetical protein DFP72DRAFT_271281 [Ephemerocybe angulata]|uniref:Uncharacterized protein n=1 Tax=Ephemerocybe angulata TaxID=980116 RepID=A0A8H6I248_9AGAR|nr:hypothetical protein DFP72DRAFT_271281 [Tulosesus angulatus]
MLSKIFKPTSKHPTQAPLLSQDIIQLLLSQYLDNDLSIAKNLSLTCKSFALFCRPYVFRIVVIPSQARSRGILRCSALERFKRFLKRSPFALSIIQTLRITDTHQRIRLYGTRPGASLTEEGESLCYILSQQFTQLRSIELPSLGGYHHWSRLPRKAQEALSSFLNRHPLEYLSITSYYPLDLARLCPTLTRLEFRIHYPDDVPLGERVPESVIDATSALPGDPLHRPPLDLRELSIQDPCSGISTIETALTSIIKYESLETLTYHGNDEPGPALTELVKRANSLTSLRLSVFSGLHRPPLDLSAHTKLKHLKLKIDLLTTWIGPALRTLLVQGSGSQTLESLHFFVKTERIGSHDDSLFPTGLYFGDALRHWNQATIRTGRPPPRIQLTFCVRRKACYIPAPTSMLDPLNTSSNLFLKAMVKSAFRPIAIDVEIAFEDTCTFD